MSVRPSLLYHLAHAPAQQQASCSCSCASGNQACPLTVTASAPCAAMLLQHCPGFVAGLACITPQLQPSTGCSSYELHLQHASGGHQLCQVAAGSKPADSQ